MRRTFSADAGSLSEVRRFIRERAEKASLRQNSTDDLVLAVSEVCANAVQHAGGASFVVSWTAGPSEPTKVNVQDEGVFAGQGIHHPHRSRGFGLPLVAALVDELSILRGTPLRPGTTVCMVKYRDAAAHSPEPDAGWA